MLAIDFTLEFGIYGANYKPLRGALWRASFFDREQQQFYAGSSDDPWEAIAWALYEREARIANGNHPTMARINGTSPLEALDALRTRPAHEARLARFEVYARIADSDPVIAEAIEGRIEAVTAKPSAAARRSRTKKGGSRG